MDVLKVEPQKDGSAIVTLEMTQHENDMLVEYAVLDILRKEIERKENEQGANGNKGLPTEETLKSEDL